MIGFGAISAVLILAIQLFPNTFASGIAGIGLVFTGWFFLLLSSTFMASKLGGLPKTLFQIAVAVGFPSILSLYFLVDTTSMEHVFSNMMRLSILLPLAIIAYISWAGADQLNRDTPVTGFLFVAAGLFVLCWLFHNGTVVDPSDFEPNSSSLSVAPEEARNNRVSGQYFGLYVVYVGISYAAMLLKMDLSTFQWVILCSGPAKHLV